MFLVEPANVTEGKEETKINLAVECVRMGHATPKSIKYSKGNTTDSGNDATTSNGEAADGDGDIQNNYEALLLKAYKEAVEAKRGRLSAMRPSRTFPAGRSWWPAIPGPPAAASPG